MEKNAVQIVQRRLTTKIIRIDSLEIASRVDLTAFQALNIANQRIANKKPTYHNNKKIIKDVNIKDKVYKDKSNHMNITKVTGRGHKNKQEKENSQNAVYKG